MKKEDQIETFLSKVLLLPEAFLPNPFLLETGVTLDCYSDVGTFLLISAVWVWANHELDMVDCFH
jgi:hypothetical protein